MPLLLVREVAKEMVVRERSAENADAVPLRTHSLVTAKQHLDRPAVGRTPNEGGRALERLRGCEPMVEEPFAAVADNSHEHYRERLLYGRELERTAVERLHADVTR